MKVRDYTIRNPFYSYEGQFEEGKRSLAGGIPVKILRDSHKVRVFTGDNAIDYFLVDSIEALNKGTDFKSRVGMLKVVALDQFERVIGEREKVKKEQLDQRQKELF